MNKFYPDLKFPTTERELIDLKGYVDWHLTKKNPNR
jgi:hypothetical protein